MEEVSLTETEARYYSDLFICCDVEKTGKIPMLNFQELLRSSNVSNEVLTEITSLAAIPQQALHISRAQFYSCLKLIAAHQAAMPLREELVVATVPLPLPRFSWKESPSLVDGNSAPLSLQANGSITAIPPPPSTDRKNSLTRRQQDNRPEVRPTTGSRKNSLVQQQQQQQLDAATNSDLPSTDSEVEQNESSGGLIDTSEHGSSSRGMHRRRAGSPEAWSTNSDSPTPTNSVAERPWAKENLWHGLLGDEHRQLLGTEEESSDRHSSDDDIQDSELETIYQITPEQRDYYYNHFKAVQPDPNGLLSGQVARNFFEKSRVPVEELRHIWQLCDVTRDGSLSLYEFTAAMHLVVLRHNNIPLPKTLPPNLHPNVLQNNLAPKQVVQAQPQEPPEADLLHLNDDDDDDEDNTEHTIISSISTATSTAVAPNNDKNIMNLSTLSTSSQISIKSRPLGSVITLATGLTPPPPPPPPPKVIQNSPHDDPNSSPSNSLMTRSAFKNKEKTLWTTDVPPTQWTKFTESPTSNVSSPGPKPVNFDMQRTAQAVVSDPQILHPVPLRVTPVAGATSNSTATESVQNSSEVFDNVPNNSRSYSPKQIVQTNATHHRDSLPQQQQQSNDLRAIQRPQAKKLPSKNAGVLPPPPQREPSLGSSSSNSGIVVGAGGDAENSINSNNNCNNNSHIVIGNKKDIQPPLPPPRPHRHGRSSSLDLNKFKISSNGGGQQAEITTQASFDLQSSTTKLNFADFTQFADDGSEDVTDSHSEQQHSLPPQQQQATSGAATAALPFSRISLQSNQRVSAFEIYRKPNTPRNSQSPPQPQPPAPQHPPPPSHGAASFQLHHYVSQQPQPQPQPIHPPPPVPFGAVGAAAIAGAAPVPIPNADHYEKRVNAITDSLRHVSFRPESSMTDILRHLREQNSLLLHLCNDLSDELLSVQTRKEELRTKLDANEMSAAAAAAAAAANNNKIGANNIPIPRTGSSISAPVTANITGGSGSSGVHSNV